MKSIFVEKCTQNDFYIRLGRNYKRNVTFATAQKVKQNFFN